MKTFLSSVAHTTVLILLHGFFTQNAFAQNSQTLDWSSFNNTSVCSESEASSMEGNDLKFNVMTAEIQENKIKKILLKKEVIIDVGRVSKFRIDGNDFNVSTCAPLPISQVSVGTTVRCFAQANGERFYIYLRRYVNNLTGKQIQNVSVMDEKNQITSLNPGNCRE